MHFSIPPIFEEITSCFRISLNQLNPNSFLLLCRVTVIFNYYRIPLTPPFHCFFYLKKGEAGLFFFIARPSSQFLQNFLSSHKQWKIHYFFVCPSTPFSYLHQWQTDLPSRSDLNGYRDTIGYQDAISYLQGLCLGVNILMEEDLLFYYGLSPMPTKLALSLGSYINPKFQLLTNLLYDLLFDK